MFILLQAYALLDDFCYEKIAKALSVKGERIIMRDATAIARELKEKKISHGELIQQIQQRVEVENPRLNALVTFEPSLLSSSAYSVESEHPLAGMFFPLKMLGQEKKGWSATAGSRLLKNHRASRNSNYVTQLEKIGLIPLGQTNAPEFGFKNITDPKIYGSAKNPWDTTLSPGGSSGGAAATVASGIFPIAGASDGGGSIRIPASFCGLIGLKPSRGTMPVGPQAWRGWQGAPVDFALTISMRDTQTLFEGMRTIHSGAPYQVSAARWQTHPKKQKLTIAVCYNSPVGTKVSAEAIQAVKDASRFLEQEGHQLIEIEYPLDGRELIDSYYLMNGAETANMLHQMELSLGRPILAGEIEPMSWAIFQYGKKLSAAAYIDSLSKWDHAAIRMEELFQRFDAFLSPTTATTAPRLDHTYQTSTIKQRMATIEKYPVNYALETITLMFEESLAITPFTQLANLTGQPAISLPTHRTQTGLPLGVQFMAARGREDILFQLGYLFEQEQKFYLPKVYQPS